MQDSARYTMYVDESEVRDLKHIDPDYPVLGVCGFVISEDSYQDRFCPALDEVKRVHFGTDRVVLTSSAIRHKKGLFAVLTDPQTNASFIQDVNHAMGDTDYWLICAVIHKLEHTKRYVCPSDPYELCVDFLLERFVHFIKCRSALTARVVFESRGPKEDARVQREYCKALEQGTDYISSPLFRRHLATTPTFRQKRDNVNGLQGADLAAYPIARTVLDQAPYPSFPVLAPKLYGGLYDEPHKYGLKCFPSGVAPDIPDLICQLCHNK